MKIRNIEQLNQFLDEEISWRRKELSVLLGLIKSSPEEESKCKTLIRSGITVLYAHWEGFVKRAATAYLNYVVMQKLKYNQLTSNFLALAMKGKLNLMEETNRATVFNEVTEFILSGLDKRCSINYKRSINTESNLSSQVFKQILSVLNLDYSPYELKEKFIDMKILRRRNAIAHGERLDIDKEEYISVHKELIEIINSFKNQIDNAADIGAYKR